jgi:gamma-glutamyl:cysteine ligase YbdK (ATP-grasp superfamily)
MILDPVTILFSSVVSAIITLSKPFIDWYKARRDANNKDDEQKGKQELAKEEQQDKQMLALNAQLFEMYKTLVATLTDNVKQLTEKVTSMEEAHLKCQAQNLQLCADVKSLETKVEFLTEQLQKKEGNSPALSPVL